MTEMKEELLCRIFFLNINSFIKGNDYIHIPISIYIKNSANRFLPNNRFNSNIFQNYVEIDHLLKEKKTWLFVELESIRFNKQTALISMFPCIFEWMESIYLKHLIQKKLALVVVSLFSEQILTLDDLVSMFKLNAAQCAYFFMTEFKGFLIL